MCLGCHANLVHTNKREKKSAKLTSALFDSMISQTIRSNTCYNTNEFSLVYLTGSCGYWKCRLKYVNSKF